MRRMSKWFLLVFVLVFAPRAHAADCVWTAASSSSVRSVVATGAEDCTFTVATAASTDGMALSSVGTFTIEICADSGETISTAFALSAYIYSPYSLKWSSAPSWDVPTNGDTGNRCTTLASFRVPGPVGRIAFAPSAGAVSGGNITITLTAVEQGKYDGNTLL